MLGVFRILLALSVFFAHVTNGHWFSGVGGDTAVELFFVISGFYIQEILSETYKSKRSFFINRLLRIYPIYIAILVLTILSEPQKYFDAFKSLTDLGRVIFLGSNLGLLGLDQMYFLNEYNPQYIFDHLGTTSPSSVIVIVPVAWTISLELFFYLIAPKLARAKIGTLVFLVTLSMSGKIVFLRFNSSEDPWSYRFLPFEISFFLIGMLMSRVKRSKIQIAIRSRTMTSLWIISVLGWYCYGVHLASHLTHPREAVLLSGCALIFVGTLIRNQTPLLRKIGDLSYPLYLSHVLIASQTPRLFALFDLEMQPNWVITLAITICASMILLSLSSPIEKLRTKIRMGEIK